MKDFEVEESTGLVMERTDDVNYGEDGPSKVSALPADFYDLSKRYQALHARFGMDEFECTGLVMETTDDVNYGEDDPSKVPALPADFYDLSKRYQELQARFGMDEFEAEESTGLVIETTNNVNHGEDGPSGVSALPDDFDEFSKRYQILKARFRLDEFKADEFTGLVIETTNAVNYGEDGPSKMSALPADFDELSKRYQTLQARFVLDEFEVEESTGLVTETTYNVNYGEDGPSKVSALPADFDELSKRYQVLQARFGMNEFEAKESTGFVIETKNAVNYGEGA